MSGRRHTGRAESEQRRQRRLAAIPAEQCPECGKRCYVTRKAARRAARVIMPGEQLSVYRCGDYFHFGHTPYPIARGVQARADR